MTLPAEPPTLRLRDRAGRVNRFILRRLLNPSVEFWTTHGIRLVGPTPQNPNGYALWMSRTGATVRVDATAPGDDLLLGLAEALERVGIVAEHLRGEEAWPT